MIQNWIGKLLFNICGDLVEDFPNNEIEINKWQGVGEKKNIKLKQNKITEWMMEYFGLNIDVKVAEIGLLQFKIPWNKLWKEPTKILIKDAIICVQCKPDFSYELMQIRQKNKQKDFIEHQYKKLFTNFTQQKKESKIKRLLKNFFSEMIILEVQNCHIRLVDENNCIYNHRIALGISFKKLTLQPQYSNKNEQEIKRKLDFQIEQLSAYLKFEQSSKINDFIYDNYDQQIINNFQTQYDILEPFTLKIVVSTNLTQEEDSPLRLTEILFLDQIKLNIDDFQFLSILRLLRLREWYCQEGEYLKFRPDFSIRPKEGSIEWNQYWIQIIKESIENRKKRRLEFHQIEQKRLLRDKYFNFILIDLFHSQYQQNEDRKYTIQDQVYDHSEIIQQKQELENMIFNIEEIEFVFSRVNKLLSQSEQLKNYLINLNLESQISPENKKSTIWSYFWKQKQQIDEGTEFQQSYEKLYNQLQEQETRCLKRYNIIVKNIQINLKIAQEKNITFMRIEFQDSQLLYDLYHQKKNIILNYQRIDAFDCLTPNKEFQSIFTFHSFVQRSQKQQFFNQQQPQIELIFEQNTKQNTSLLKITTLPHLMCLNDTVIARLQPFLKQLRKHNYFYDIITLSQGNLKQAEFINILNKLCKSSTFNIDVNISSITLKIPESSVKFNCPILVFILENYKLQFYQQVKQEINKFSINFQYIEKGNKEEIIMLEPISMISQVIKQNENITDLKIDTIITDVQITIPILNRDFLKNFIYNVLGTLDNLKKIQLFLEKEDLLNFNQSNNNRRKRSRSWSQRELSSKRDECSSQTSEIYYDAEEFVNIPFLATLTQSRQQQSPQERREILLNKWKKIKLNLNYLVNTIFKDTDPRISKFIESIQLRANFILNQIKLKIATQKNIHNDYSYFIITNIQTNISKSFQQKSFDFKLIIDDILISLYKINQIKQITKYAGPKQEDIMQNVNEDMLNLLPFLLRIKLLQINYQINIKTIRCEFQMNKKALLRQFIYDNISPLNNTNKQTQQFSNQSNFIFIEISQFQLQSKQPFQLVYKKELSDKPFFLEMSNSQVSQWDTTCECKFKFEIQYFNYKIEKYEPFIEQTNTQFSFQKSPQELTINIKFNELYFNITPNLIYTLVCLNQSTLQIKQFLFSDLNDSFQEVIQEQKQSHYQKFEIQIENEDDLLLVDQIEIQHTTHYKPKYKIKLEKKISEQQKLDADTPLKSNRRHVQFQELNEEQEKLGQDQNRESEAIQRVSSEIDVSEKKLEKKKYFYEKWKKGTIGDIITNEQSTTYIFVNLTVQKLLFNLNGIEQYIKEKESKFLRCTDDMSFKITPSSRHFKYTASVKTMIENSYFLKTKSRDEKFKNIYYLLSVINQNSIIIYSIEQLPKSPYLFKNKCSQLIAIQQKGFIDSQTFIEPGHTEQFCWEDPFINPQIELQIRYGNQNKHFIIDIDRFNNQEIQIDKNLNSQIDTEYSLEIFNDGLQKVIVLTETESLKKKTKRFKIECNTLGISLIDQLEIIYMEINNLEYQQSFQKDSISYQLTAQNIQFDAQGYSIPKRQIYIMNNQPLQKSIISTISQRKSSAQTLSEISINPISQFKLKCKQKAISEILVHLKYIKIKIPSYKISIDGNLIMQLFSFVRQTKDLLDNISKRPLKNFKQQQQLLQLSFDKLNNSNLSDKSKAIQPKKIHLDRLLIKSFSIKIKFKNLQVVEEQLNTLHHYAGLISYILGQFQQVNLNFQTYQLSDYQQVMESNYEFHIKQLFQVFSKSLNDQLRGQLNTTNFLKNQGNLAKQLLQELQTLQVSMDQNDNFSFGTTFKFQLLQTGLIVGHSLLIALQSTLVTVLEGVFTYFETTKPDQLQQRQTFSNRLSKLFKKVSDYKFINSFNNQELSFQMLTSKLKTRRFPKYIQNKQQLTNYQEDLAKFQLYRLWKLGIEKQYNHFKLDIHIFLFISSDLFLLLDTQYNQILLEIQLKAIQSIGNINETCIIRYFKGKSQQEGIDDIGMKQLKIEKIVLNCKVDDKIIEQINQLIKVNIEKMKIKDSQIFSIMMV